MCVNKRRGHNFGCLNFGYVKMQAMNNFITTQDEGAKIHSN
jgi:hypothetical protein